MPHWHTTQGQSLIEFALVVSILLLLLMGIFDLGWAVYAKNTIADAAREGARTGIILSATDAQITARVQAAAPALANLQINIVPGGTRTFGQPITVTVNYTYTAITPIIGGIVTGSGLPLTASSSMMVEGVIVPLPTATAGPSPTATNTSAPTPTNTGTPTRTSTPTNTATRTPTNTPTNTPCPGDFTISASPPSLTLRFPSNRNGNYTITLTSQGGFNVPVILSVSGVPANATATFSQNPVTPTPTGANSTMTIAITNQTQAGTYPLLITGIGCGKTRTTTVTLIVQ